MRPQAHEGIFMLKSSQWRWLIIISGLFFSNVSANLFTNNLYFKPGIYLDAEIGVTDPNYQSIRLKGTSQPNFVTQVGAGPRIAIGYDFDRYVGLELSVIYFQRPRLYGLSADSISANVKHNLVGLLVKATLPLQHWDITAKGGIGYIVRGNITLYGSYTPDAQMGDYTALVGGQFLCPVYGLTVARHFTPHWSIETSWQQAPAEGVHQLPVSNFWGIGSTYKF